MRHRSQYSAETRILLGAQGTALLGTPDIVHVTLHPHINPLAVLRIYVAAVVFADWLLRLGRQSPHDSPHRQRNHDCCGAEPPSCSSMLLSHDALSPWSTFTWDRSSGKSADLR